MRADSVTTIRCRWRTTTFTLALMLMSSSDAWATIELVAPQIATSEDTLTLVRIVPSPKSSAGNDLPTAEWYRFDRRQKSYRLLTTARLASALFRVRAYVANDGTLVTVSPAYQNSSKDTIVLYRAGGSLIRRFAFSELFSDKYAECFIRTPRVASSNFINPRQFELSVTYIRQVIPQQQLKPDSEHIEWFGRNYFYRGKPVDAIHVPGTKSKMCYGGSLVDCQRAVQNGPAVSSPVKHTVRK